jgi:hypothetical protein
MLFDAKQEVTGMGHSTENCLKQLMEQDCHLVLVRIFVQQNQELCWKHSDCSENADTEQ